MSDVIPPGRAWSQNVRAISYMDLEGRPAFKMAIHRSGERWYLYAAHFWHSGLTVVDITDADAPRQVRFIPGPPNTWTLQVQAADGLLITSQERILDGWGGDADQPFGEGFIIWDLSDPENPRQLGHHKTGYRGTHRNYYDGGRYVHATSMIEGYEGHIYQIVDIIDPSRPVEVSRWWYPGQWTAGGEGGVPSATFLHGGAYVKGDRAYLPYTAGGFVILDISDVTRPTLVSDLPFSPPFISFIGVHTALPLLDRPLVVVNSEAIAEHGDEPLGFTGIVDISKERSPRLISLFPIPKPHPDMGIRNFYEWPGRSGPHNQHQPQFQKVLYQDENTTFLTYFNAGLRIYDISDERTPHEIGYFVAPHPVQRRGPLPSKGLVTQSEDVVVDSRGNIFVSDKNHGIYVLRFDDPRR
jgi:hypothetical protein